jgi:hypothetical protein
MVLWTMVATPLYHNLNQKVIMLKKISRWWAWARESFFDWSYKEDEEEVHEVSPSVVNKKRKARVVLEIPKKPKSSTALVIQGTNYKDSWVGLIFYMKERRWSYNQGSDGSCFGVWSRLWHQLAFRCYSIVCEKRSKRNIFNHSHKQN